MFLLRPSAPPTGAIASGYSQSMWPTPTAVERANEGNVRILRAKVLSGEMTEQEAVDILSKSPFEPQGKIPALWPTPNVAGGGNQCELTPHKGHYLRPSGQKAHLGLDQAVRMWPTPCAGDDRDRGHANMPAIKRRMANGKQVMLSMAIQQERGQKLSAAWTLVLMGYSPDWCDLED